MYQISLFTFCAIGYQSVQFVWRSFVYASGNRYIASRECSTPPHLGSVYIVILRQTVSFYHNSLCHCFRDFLFLFFFSLLVPGVSGDKRGECERRARNESKMPTEIFRKKKITLHVMSISSFFSCPRLNNEGPNDYIRVVFLCFPLANRRITISNLTVIGNNAPKMAAKGVDSYQE